MQTKQFTLTSDYDGLTLHVSVIEPDGEKKGVIHILHGMCEYKERYEEVMRFFAQNGYVVACHDHRGHGDSVLRKEDLGYFYETKAEAIVEDAALVTRKLKADYEGLPVVLYGHSMGSMVARCYLQKHDTLVDKVIVSGSPGKNPLSGVAVALAKLIGAFKGMRHRSKMLAYLSTGKGNDNFPNEPKGAWLSRNRQNIDEFYSNPKGKYRFTCNGFANLFLLMKHTYTKKRYQVQNKGVKILFISGSDDAVLGGEKLWKQMMEMLRQVGYTSVEGKLYEGLRHEVHNEIGREEVLADLLQFVNA